MRKTNVYCESDCTAFRGRLKATPKHIAALKALAHLDRLQVFFHLVKCGEAQPANEIKAALKLAGPTLSHHLDQLDRAGLIERRRHERYILSSVRHEMVSDLVRLLTACC